MKTHIVIIVAQKYMKNIPQKSMMRTGSITLIHVKNVVPASTKHASLPAQVGTCNG